MVKSNSDDAMTVASDKATTKPKPDPDPPFDPIDKIKSGPDGPIPDPSPFDPSDTIKSRPDPIPLPPGPAPDDDTIRSDVPDPPPRAAPTPVGGIIVGGPGETLYANPPPDLWPLGPDDKTINEHCDPGPWSPLGSASDTWSTPDHTVFHPCPGDPPRRPIGPDDKTVIPPTLLYEADMTDPYAYGFIS